MKKLIILLLVLFVFSNFAYASNLSGSEIDVAGTGKYVDFRKITNHKYEKIFDIHFTANAEGSKVSWHISPDYIAYDMNEMITLTLDGKKYTQPRKIWYDILELKMNGQDHENFKKVFGVTLYNQWYEYYSAKSNAESLAGKYIQNVYLPREFGYEPPKPRHSNAPLIFK